MRVNTTDSKGACLAARCFPSDDAALRDVARGNIEAWRRARNNVSGLYLDGVNLIDSQWQTTRAATGVTGYLRAYTSTVTRGSGLFAPKKSSPKDDLGGHAAVVLRQLKGQAQEPPNRGRSGAGAVARF